MSRQPDIQELTVRGLRLLDKLGMLTPAERSLTQPYVACLELYLDAARPAPPVTSSNVVSFDDASAARRVQRAETQRRVAQQRDRGHAKYGVDAYGWDVYDGE